MSYRRLCSTGLPHYHNPDEEGAQARPSSTDEGGQKIRLQCPRYGRESFLVCFFISHCASSLNRREQSLSYCTASGILFR